MILVAEDADVNRDVMSAMLARLGVRHRVVSNGAEALEFVANNACALVLMDLKMPVMDGLAATRAIRRLPGEAGRVPIVCMSAGLFTTDENEATASGMVAMLAKPFSMSELAAVIATHASVPDENLQARS